MKIAILNTYEQMGGAAKAAYRLFLGLREAGHDTAYLVRTRSGKPDPDIVQMDAFNRSLLAIDKLMQRYYATLNRTPVSNTPFTITYAGVNTTLTPRLQEADIVNLHWIEKFLSLQSLQQILALGKPVVWTLHDEKPFTGGCHYTSGCEAFREDCGECPQLKYDPYRVARKTLEAKLELLKEVDLTIVTPSRWLAERAASSALFRGRRIEVVPNGVDTEIYRPMDKGSSKAVFGIDSETVVLQFGAQDTREKRKGFASLVEAIDIALEDETFAKMAKEGKIVVLCVGEPSGEIEALPIEKISTGYIDGDEKMARLYDATDLFVLPSLEDNLPNTMLESMACGTPVVGYASGGIAEVVDENNGRTVPTGDSRALAGAIVEMVLNEQSRKECGKRARELVVSRYKISDQVERYLELFREISEARGESRKKKDEDFGRHFDCVAGYALRMEAKRNNHLFREEKAPESEERKDPRLSELLSSLERLCAVRVWKHPLKKLEAYRELLALYHRIKNGV
ncbi:glycosyltransferase family 4 protein [Hydrogenimonas sp.]